MATLEQRISAALAAVGADIKALRAGGGGGGGAPGVVRHNSYADMVAVQPGADNTIYYITDAKIAFFWSTQYSQYMQLYSVESYVWDGLDVPNWAFETRAWNIQSTIDYIASLNLGGGGGTLAKRIIFGTSPAAYGVFEAERSDPDVTADSVIMATLVPSDDYDADELEGYTLIAKAKTNGLVFTITADGAICGDFGIHYLIGA